MDVATIRDALAAANYKMAFSISLSRYGGPWLDNLLKNPPADLETLIRRTFQLYLSVPQTRGRVYDWAASFSQTFFWRFLGAWQFGLFTPLVERSVAALRAYENATIDADIIFYGALGVNKCTTPVHLFDEKERRRMWLELYEQVLAEVSEDRPSVFDAELTDAEVRAMASVFRARGSGLVKRWVKMQGSCFRQ